MDNTVKVDIQKLQLLNDRIAQTIDALNQVRMSVHGIQHTSPMTPYGVSPYGIPSPYAAVPSPYAMPSPYAAPPGYPFMQPGLSHSTPFTPYTTQPFATQLGFAPQGIPQTTAYGGFVNPFVGGGLTHTTPVTGTTIDPTWTLRTQGWPVTGQVPYAQGIPFGGFGTY
jgi:hypothetical protein